MREMGLEVSTVHAGHANMFRSPLFAEAFATVTDATVELYNTDGSQGAARGAGIGAGLYHSASDAFKGLDRVKVVEPNANVKSAYQEAYGKWHEELERRLAQEE